MGDIEQRREGVPDGAVLDPGLGVDDAGGDHRVLGCMDETPPPAVGDDADGHAAGAEHELHPVDR